MKVKGLSSFFDRTENLRMQQAGDELEVSKERADFLVLMGLVSVIKVPVKKTTKEA